jgi:magnesium transporter
MTIIEYNENQYNVHNGTIEEIGSYLKVNNEQFVQWIDIDISEMETIREIAKIYGLHQLSVEDVNKTELLPKFETFENYFFVSLKMMNIDEDSETVFEHISFVVGKGFVITFQMIPGDVFDDVRKRIREFSGNIRKRKSDYLLIRLFDAVVDNYGIVLEHTRNHIENLEDSLLNRKKIKIDLITEILHIKRHLNTIRSFIMPLKDILGRFRVETGSFFNKSSIAYLNDIHDQVIFQINSFETMRDMLKDLIDIHNTQMSNEMNMVMKTLTIISAIFIPLTFIAGWYGMNFRHMPELENPWSYPILIIIMSILAFGMIIYMKRKKWM